MIKTRKIRARVSMPMTKVIQAAVPEYSVSLVRFTPAQYGQYVNYDVWAGERDIDNNGLIKAIRIEYPPEYYACPAYLSTNDIERIARNSGGTYDGFLAAVRDYVMI